VRLLIVEDERRLADSLKRRMSAEGYWADVAYDGGSGLERALADSYDAIILDVMLPVLSGYAVCSRLREAGVTTPILMLTAKSGEYDEAEALDIGADDYVTKPFSSVVLLARLRALLRRDGRDGPKTMQAGDLTLEPRSLQCRRGDTRIELTAREFAVLSYLVQRAGQVVSKRDMLDEVWDWADELDPNIVEVYVSALRRKIDTPFGRRTIQTVRGAGYRLVPDGD